MENENCDSKNAKSLIKYVMLLQELPTMIRTEERGRKKNFLVNDFVLSFAHQFSAAHVGF